MLCLVRGCRGASAPIARTEDSGGNVGLRMPQNQGEHRMLSNIINFARKTQCGTLRDYRRQVFRHRRRRREQAHRQGVGQRTCGGASGADPELRRARDQHRADPGDSVRADITDASAKVST